MAGGTDPCVVTGASGFVGAALVRHLHAAGRPVVAVARRGCQVPSGVQLVVLPSYEAPELGAALQGASAVFHLASVAHRQADAGEFAASVRAAAAVAAAAARAQVPRLVFTSSIGVLGQRTQGQPLTEASPAAPAEPYAASKLQAEQAVLAATRGGATRSVIVRPPMVYGPGAPGNFGRLLRLVRRGVPLPLASIRNRRTFIALDNLLDLLVLCADHPAAAGGLFVAGDAEDLSTPELVRCIAGGLGRPARLLAFPPPLLQVLARAAGQGRIADSLCASLQVDASRARRLLGWRPRIAAPEGVRQAAAATRRP